MPVNDGVSDFCHLAAHDLQAPLRQARHLSECIRGFVQKEEPERARACATELETILDKMKHLVTALLDLSTTANLVTEFVIVDMARIAEAAIARNRLGMLETGADIVIRKLPQVLGDADLLTRALAILVGNAILYVDADTRPQILIEGEAKNKIATIRIYDNGIGIPDGYHKRVFDPLIRVHSSPAHYGGLGIGLSLCQKILRSHGGDITASARVENGTLFTPPCPSPK